MRRSQIRATIVVFESPKRVQTMVAEALDTLGDRPAVVARELTKLHEEVIRGQLSELPAMLDADVERRDRRRDRRSGTVHDGRAGGAGRGSSGARRGGGTEPVTRQGRREAAWHLREQTLRPVARAIRLVCAILVPLDRRRIVGRPARGRYHDPTMGRDIFYITTRSTTRTTCPTSGTPTTLWPPTWSPGSIACAARRSSTSRAPTSTA